MPKRKTSIRLSGSAARSFMASAMIEHHGKAAAKNTTGPMKKEIEKQLAVSTQLKIRIWTQCHRPFMMGGDVHRPIATVVNAEGPFDLGKGFKGYLITNPKGNVSVVEAESGGIVADSLDAARKDIADCADLTAMKKQVAEATERGKYAENMTPAEFWGLFK